MELPSKSLERAVQALSRLPGIGRRSALRLALHMLRQGNDRILDLSEALEELATNSQFCQKCHAISDQALCGICQDERRDLRSLCVVEDIRDVLALENTHAHRGRYHVLGGLISPMDGMGPGDLTVDDLVQRVSDEGIEEVILALSATMEGDTTAFYIYRKLGDLPIRLTAIARGLPVGDALEFADEVTLSRSFQQRVPFESTLNR
ncbi:MAG: recombination protein RecR [Flavobacteriia bacterium]|jgi:recombination protein RecR|nr:recombination protein RecR [Flavobacteriia bacterium]NDD47838.1 recombination protein RecR [Flavobacteriia bacterium]